MGVLDLSKIKQEVKVVHTRLCHQFGLHLSMSDTKNGGAEKPRQSINFFFFFFLENTAQQNNVETEKLPWLQTDFA